MSYFHELIKRQSCHHMETSQLIYRANQLTGFYMMATLVFNGLNIQVIGPQLVLGKTENSIIKKSGC